MASWLRRQARNIREFGGRQWQRAEDVLMGTPPPELQAGELAPTAGGEQRQAEIGALIGDLRGQAEQTRAQREAMIGQLQGQLMRGQAGPGELRAAEAIRQQQGRMASSAAGARGITAGAVQRQAMQGQQALGLESGRILGQVRAGEQIQQQNQLAALLGQQQQGALSANQAQIQAIMAAQGISEAEAQRRLQIALLQYEQGGTEGLLPAIVAAGGAAIGGAYGGPQGAQIGGQLGGAVGGGITNQYQAGMVGNRGPQVPLG